MPTNTYIALLRGINVGGKNLLPMKDLTTLLESLGATRVQTYIQSGNVVFQSTEKNTEKLSQRISAALGQQHNIESFVLLLRPTALQNAITENPFPQAEANPSSLHLGFLAAPPTHPDIAKLNQAKSETEQYKLGDRVFYLHAPEGIGRSKIVACAEKYLGVPTTFRNWRTVSKIMEMAEAKLT